MRTSEPLTRLAIALLVLASLSACETTQGVLRKVTLEKLPDGDCIVSRVRATPGVVRATESTQANPRERLLSVILEGAGDTIILRVNARPDGAYELSQSSININRARTDEQLIQIRVLMLAIERSLSGECGLPPLQETVREYWLGGPPQRSRD